MMGNFFKRVYYGKGNKKDFTKDDLPANRWSLFWSMVRVNASRLFGANLLFVLFALPLYFWVFELNLPALSNLYDAGASAEEIGNLVVQMVYGTAPCVFLLSFGFCGLTYLSTKMAKDQNVWVWSDFWHAIKVNWKQTMLLGLLNALIVILAYVAITFYGTFAGDTALAVIPQVLVWVGVVLWIFVNLYAWPMMVSYELPFGKMLKNCLILAIGRLPQTVLMALLAAVLPALWFVAIDLWVYIITYVLYIFIGFAFVSLAIVSITNAIFDRDINVRIEGAKINQGLRIAYEDEVTEEDDD